MSSDSGTRCLLGCVCARREGCRGYKFGKTAPRLMCVVCQRYSCMHPTCAMKLRQHYRLEHTDTATDPPAKKARSLVEPEAQEPVSPEQLTMRGTLSVADALTQLAGGADIALQYVQLAKRVRCLAADDSALNARRCSLCSGAPTPVMYRVEEGQSECQLCRWHAYPGQLPDPADDSAYRTFGLPGLDELEAWLVLAQGFPSQSRAELGLLELGEELPSCEDMSEHLAMKFLTREELSNLWKGLVSHSPSHASPPPLLPVLLRHSPPWCLC